MGSWIFRSSNWVDFNSIFDVRNLQGLNPKVFWLKVVRILQQARRFLWRCGLPCIISGRKTRKNDDRSSARTGIQLDTSKPQPLGRLLSWRIHLRQSVAVSQMHALLLQLFEEQISFLADEPEWYWPINRRFHPITLSGNDHPGMFRLLPLCIAGSILTCKTSEPQKHVEIPLFVRCSRHLTF